MAEFVLFKQKEFKLQKDALAWAKDEKKKYGGTKPVRVETDYNPQQPLPWTGKVFLKDG